MEPVKVENFAMEPQTAEAIMKRMVNAIGREKIVNIETACLWTYCMVSSGVSMFDAQTKDDRVAVIIMDGMKKMAELVSEVSKLSSRDVKIRLGMHAPPKGRG